LERGRRLLSAADTPSVAQARHTQARPRAASGSLASAAGAIATVVHQHEVLQPAASAQALGPPQRGQRFGSGAPSMREA
jgi:hypothetical protein